MQQSAYTFFDADGRAGRLCLCLRRRWTSDHPGQQQRQLVRQCLADLFLGQEGNDAAIAPLQVVTFDGKRLLRALAGSGILEPSTLQRERECLF